MSTQPCPRCGFPNRATAKYCSQCGIDLRGPTFVYVPLRVGQTLKSGTYAYKVLQPLGKGGMGAVYLATQTLVGRERHCVIKEMLDYVDPANPGAVRKAQQRFREEAATLVELNHVGIPQIYDYFSESGRNYIAMQFIEGESLDKRLSHEDEQGQCVKGSAQPVERVVRWGIQLCRVLEYLAERKPPVIHHDIKPANIILNRATGQVCLVDFGTAKARLTMQPVGQMGVRKSSVYGTAGYAAPEMYPPRSESEPRSDVYALGATLYHLLTDDNPRDHPFQFPKLTGLPAGIHRVLEGAIKVDVQQRLTAAQMRRRLEAIEIKATPFHFRSGVAAHNLAELVELCDRHWEDAKFHFYGKDFENWLRTSLHRHDLVSKVLPVRQRGGDKDAGLEEFLHILDPTLAPPAPDVSPSTLDFGSLEVGQTKKKVLKISNKAGRGHLSGCIVADPPVTWLQIPDKFSSNAVTIETAVDTSNQKEGSRLHTKIQIQTPYVPPVEIPVRAQVALAWRRLCLTLLKFVGAGALVSTGVAYIMAQAVLPNFSWAVSDSLMGGLGLVAMLIGLMVGAWLGHGKGFSWKGCVLGGILSYPALGYAYYVLALQFLILQQWDGDETAYLSLVLLGIWIGSALGFYQGLRRARQKTLAVAVSLLVVLIPIGIFGLSEVGDLRSAYIHLGDSEVPVPYVVFAGSEPVPPPPPTSTPAPTPVHATNTPTQPYRTPTPTSRPRATATPTRRLVTPTATMAPAVPPTLPPACPHVDARITSPGVNAVLKGVVQIRGTANICDFQFYKVEFGASDKPWTWVVIGDDVVRKRVVDDVLVTWDTSKVQPGVYTLQLTVVDITGNYPSPCRVKVSVVR
jgi:serine/threonine protein kinase